MIRSVERGIEAVFPKMTKIAKPGSVGVASVEHFTVSEADARLSAMRAAFTPGGRWDAVDAGTYAKLTVAGELMMTDTRMERYTNWEFLRRANGRVLIAGLGLGMILHAAMKKREVRHVTVIEKSPDVVTLIAPTLKKYGRRVTLVTADALEWTPPRGEKWDTIYFDIWPNICEDNLTEAARLSRKYSPRLNRANEDAWMGAWRIEELRDRRRSGY